MKAHLVEGGRISPGQRKPMIRSASGMQIELLDSGRTAMALAYVDQKLVPQYKAKRATLKSILG